MERDRDTDLNSRLGGIKKYCLNWCYDILSLSQVICIDLLKGLTMRILSLLEKLATNVHHRVRLLEYIKNQPDKVQEAFLTNNSTQLKSILGNCTNLADRDKVVSINKTNS